MKKSQEIFTNNTGNNKWKKNKRPNTFTSSRHGPIKDESMKPHRRFLNDQLSRAFKTPAQDLRGRLLNLSSSGSEMGLTFIISKKLHSEQLLIQKCLHRTPASHSEGSLV